jgi:hypothetical protein
MAQVTFSYTGYAHPAWAAEPLEAEKLIPGGARLDAAVFPRQDQQTVTLAAGVVTSGTGKTLTLTTALSYDIPSGTILDFGSGEFATLTTGATKGATTITGVTLAADLEGGESVTWAGVSPIRTVQSGTLVGRTFTERDNRAPYGLPDVTTPDDELFLTAFSVPDLAQNADVTLVRHGTLIYEDKLPGWAGLASNAKAAIRARYQCIRSA